MIGPSPDRSARLIAEKIETRALPCRHPYTTVTKMSRGDTTCAACDHLIRPMAAECVCEIPFQPTISFHFDCFREWRDQASRAIDASGADDVTEVADR